ncbi:MAG: hypothetical protein ACREMY_07185, partial [bacterium]
AELRNFLTEHGVSVTGGYFIGLTQGYTPGSGATTGVGIVTPQIGVSYNYSYQGRGSIGAKW